jgi:ATP-binding cassette subfamily C protein
LTTQPSTFRALRWFTAAAIANAPSQAVETAIVTLVLSATEGVSLLLLVPLLQLVGVEAQGGSLSRIVQAFAEAFHAFALRPTLGVVLVVYVAIVWLQGLLQRRHAVLSTDMQQQIMIGFRNRLYSAMAGMRWIHFARIRASDYAQLLTNEVDRVGAAAYFLIDLLVSGVIALVYVALAFRVSPAMTTFALACAAMLALTMRGKVERARAMGEELSASWTRFYAAISENVSSVKIAKGYGAESRHAEIFNRLSAELGDVSLIHTRCSAQLRQRLSVGSAAVLAAVVYVSYTVLAVSTAQLLLLLFVFARLVPRLTSLYEKMHALAAVLPAFTVLAEAERRCLDAAEPATDRQGSIALTDRIEFDRVTFDYKENGETPAVRNVSLALVAGATTAIVGSSGAGKSTLADLLMGLLTPSEGRILVDGVPIGPQRIRGWREQIGYVAQETFLFHDSVRANLLWARPDASEEELWRALRLASADEFVRALPQGLDTIVGDRGALISGGERQRLSLARAVVRRPTLLILDEATSSLDSESEGRIQQAIDGLHHQITIVIITHRLSTIRGADAIHVLERGRLVESGAWDELLGRRKGRFRDLCHAQGVYPNPVEPSLRIVGAG